MTWGTGSRRDGGFTLVEMLAVLAITAVVSAVAFPAIEVAEKTVALQQTQALLEADLRIARGRALATGAPTRIAIGQAGGVYGWQGGPVRRLPDGMRLQASDGGSPAFFPDGSARAGILALSTGGARKLTGVSETGVVYAVPAASARR